MQNFCFKERLNSFEKGEINLGIFESCERLHCERMWNLVVGVFVLLLFLQATHNDYVIAFSEHQQRVTSMLLILL
jgi:hypothetical protein